MDELSQARFDRLIKSNPETLSDAQVSFLRARREYMSKSQLRDFAEILEDKPKAKPKSSKEKTKQSK